MANPGSLVTAALALCFSFGTSNAVNLDDAIASSLVELPITISVSDNQSSNFNDSVEYQLRSKAAFWDEVVYTLQGIAPLTATPASELSLGDEVELTGLSPLALGSAWVLGDTVTSDLVEIGAAPVTVGIADDQGGNFDDDTSDNLRHTAAFWDSINVIERLLGQFGDLFTPTDAVDKSSTIQVTLSDTVEITEGPLSLTGVYDTGTDLSEEFIPTDDVSWKSIASFSISDSFVPTEGLDQLHIGYGFPEDSATLTDQLSAIELDLAEISDNQGLNFADLLTRLKTSVVVQLPYYFSDDFSAEIADQAAYELQVNIAPDLAEEFVPVDSLIGLESLLAEISDSITLDDSLIEEHSGGTYVGVSDEFADLEDSFVGLERDLVSIGSGLTYSDSVSFEIHVIVPEYVTLSYSFSESFVPAVTLSGLERDLAQVSDTVGLDDVLNNNLSVRLIETIGDIWEDLDDSGSGIQRGLVPVSEQVPFDSTVTIDLVESPFIPFFVNISDSFSPLDALGGLQPDLGLVGDNLGLGDDVDIAIYVSGGGGGGYTNIIIGLNQMGNQGPSVGGM